MSEPTFTTTLVAPLHTSGNEIFNANGQPVMLRGVMFYGMQSSTSASGVTQQAVEAAKAWGANIIRVPLGEQFWVLGNCDYDPTYALEVDQLVSWITSADMIALLDLHYNTPTMCGSANLYNMADENESPTFWQQVASRYAGNPLVAFDLFNEPHNISDSVWLNGGTTNSGPSQTYQAAGMQQLYDTVRSTGAQNLVFLSGTNWGSTPPSVLVSGNNIVYGAHAYTCPIDPPPQCTTPNPENPPAALAEWVTLAAKVPVVLTEFGWPSTSDGAYNANTIAYVQAHGMGWIAFEFEQVKNPNGYDLVFFPNGSAVPTGTGLPVFNALRAPP